MARPIVFGADGSVGALAAAHYAAAIAERREAPLRVVHVLETQLYAYGPGLLLGSVSRTLVQHAADPVAVIHPIEP